MTSGHWPAVSDIVLEITEHRPTIEPADQPLSASALRSRRQAMLRVAPAK